MLQTWFSDGLTRVEALLTSHRKHREGGTNQRDRVFVAGTRPLGLERQHLVALEYMERAVAAEAKLIPVSLEREGRFISSLDSYSVRQTPAWHGIAHLAVSTRVASCAPTAATPACPKAPSPRWLER